MRERRIEITAIEGRSEDLKFTPHPEDKRVLQLRIERSLGGIPGLSARRLDPRKAKRVKSDLRAHVPEWGDRVFHLQHSAVPRWVRGPVTRNGKRSELYYGVFGNDDCQVLGYRWHCVGRVFAWNDLSSPGPAWSGSAVLIGPRHVLTAGHVVPWDGQNCGMQFVPAYYDGKSVNGSGTQVAGFPMSLDGTPASEAPAQPQGCRRTASHGITRKRPWLLRRKDLFDQLE